PGPAGPGFACWWRVAGGRGQSEFTVTRRQREFLRPCRRGESRSELRPQGFVLRLVFGPAGKVRIGIQNLVAARIAREQLFETRFHEGPLRLRVGEDVDI